METIELKIRLKEALDASANKGGTNFLGKVRTNNALQFVLSSAARMQISVKNIWSVTEVTEFNIAGKNSGRLHKSGRELIYRGN